MTNLYRKLNNSQRRYFFISNMSLDSDNNLTWNELTGLCTMLVNPQGTKFRYAYLKEFNLDQTYTKVTRFVNRSPVWLKDNYIFSFSSYLKVLSNFLKFN